MKKLLYKISLFFLRLSKEDKVIIEPAEDEFRCVECGKIFKIPIIPYQISKFIYSDIMDFETGDEKACMDCFMVKCKTKHIHNISILPEMNIIKFFVGKNTFHARIYGHIDSMMKIFNEIKNNEVIDSPLDIYDIFKKYNVVYEIINNAIIRYDSTFRF